MTIEQYYDIHSLVRLRVCGSSSLLNEIDVHLWPFKCGYINEPIDVLIEQYENAPKVLRTTVVDDYEYGDGVYHRPSSRIRYDIFSAPQTYYMDRLNLPINLVVQMALLRKKYTFIHGAGLSIEGRHVLFPAYPGTGKTTLVSTFVKSGALMFGDDLCIIGDGYIYPYPQALSVYPHHLPILGYSNRNINRKFRNTKIIDNISTIFFRHASRPAKLARLILNSLRTPSVNILPSEVFGINAIATEKMRLDEVVVLERSGIINKLVHEETVINDIVNQASAILWHEWHASFHDLLLYDAMAESGHGTIDRFNQVCNLVKHVFQAVPCSRIRIPADWDNFMLIREFPVFWKNLSE